MRFRTRLLLFVAMALAALGYAFSRPRMPQDPAYHLFADSRAFLGVPNFLNVASNLPFLIAGLRGLILTLGRRCNSAFLEDFERWPYAVFFAGYALTCFGSGYYHWSPSNATLLWDRLAMALAFTAILAGTMGDRMGGRIGRLCLAPLAVLGVGSVLYWHISELRGVGDLRLYMALQLFPLAGIPALLVLFPRRYTQSYLLLAGGTFYLLAKVLESFDRDIFNAVGISGHTLKHLAASITAFCIVAMIGRRALAGSVSKCSAMP